MLKQKCSTPINCSRKITKDFTMQWIVEDSLTNFDFWSGAKDRANQLTYSELQELDDVLPEYFGHTPTATEINDLFWFDFGEVCNMLGLKYDSSKDDVVRDDDEEEEEPETECAAMPDAMQEAIDSIKKEHPALAEAIKAGYKACMEGPTGNELVDGPYSPDVVIDDKPNYTVIIAVADMDPHPARVSVDAYDEADAIDKAVTSLYEHGLTGYVEEDTPEHPEDYIEVSKGYVPSTLVTVQPCKNIRGTFVPEMFLSAFVNNDETGLSEQDIADLRDFEQDLEKDGIPSGSLSPVNGPDGEFWLVDDDPYTGKSVFCTAYVG